MIRRIAPAVTSFLLLGALVAGCGGAAPQETAKPADQPAAVAPAQPKQTTYPLTIKDDAGREVTLTAQPKRILSVAPANTELVFALGLGKSLVGRSDFDDYPAEVKDIPSVGGFFPPDYEKIIATKPDLVLLAAGSDEARDKLAGEYKLNVYVVDPKTFDELYNGVTKLGQVLNAQEAAEKVVTDMKAQVKAITDKVATASSKPTVYYEVWDEPLMTAGTGTFINDLITLAGGTNVGADVKGWATYSAEQVAKANPDVIVASSADIEAKIKARQGWGSFKAVKEGKIATIADPNLIVRPGPRLVLGLEWFAKTLHPELFK
jgi:iron complex transport system substrate-binding protein